MSDGQSHSKHPFGFAHSLALITGGASGIGRALAEELARRGCEVVIADLQVELAEEVAKAIVDAGGNASAVRLDVRDFAAFASLVDSLVESKGAICYVFNNAGIRIDGTGLDLSIDDWNYILDINLRGIIHGVQASYHHMVKQGFGHIINTASLAGLIPYPGPTAYATTKHAVVGLSYAYRAEGAARGVRFSALCPGLIQTPMLNNAGKFGRMLRDIPEEKQAKAWSGLRPMDVDKFASKVLDQVAKNQPLIVVPGYWKVTWWIYRFFPALSHWIARKGFLVNQRDLGIER